MSIYTEILARNAELLAWFKAAVTLAIILGVGFGAFFALWRRSEKEAEQLRDCLNEAHEAADEAEKGHMVALATLAEERGSEEHQLPPSLYITFWECTGCTASCRVGQIGKPSCPDRCMYDDAYATAKWKTIRRGEL